MLKEALKKVVIVDLWEKPGGLKTFLFMEYVVGAIGSVQRNSSAFIMAEFTNL